MDVDVTASTHKHYRSTLGRIKTYISHNQFHDVNLFGKLRPSKQQVNKLFHWKVPGGGGAWENWSFNQIVMQEFLPTAVGEAFGPLWSTHWFRVEVKVPEGWLGQEVWLRWDSQTEAMLWNEDGDPLQGLSPGTGGDNPSDHAAASLPDQARTDYPVSRCWSGSHKPLVFYVEMACNNMFGGGKDTMIGAPDEDRHFTLKTVEIFTLDPIVYKLLLDLEVLHDMAKDLPKDSPTTHHALHIANQMINYVIRDDFRRASKVADNFFSKGSGYQLHTLALIGNCHIDSAWLWQYSETKRKCARSWISTLRLMEEYPEMRFACSQAQQFAWVKTHYPGIYEKIRSQVKAGRFIPVGGTWVEMDGLIPSGESFMRQFLYGQLFYQKEFGVLCKEFWLPDTFGYSAQFPQICKHFGIERFLTQKLSWNSVNKFPHHTFLWEGLDGTTILAHFPPGDSYELKVKVDEVMRSVKNLEDKGRVSTSALLYGHGDGGGGPTREMLERARRLANVEGCPRLEHMTPDSFFEVLEAERRNLCRWTGELYLELHNGTYTSQASTKCENQGCEFILRFVEMLLAVAAMKGKLSEPQIQEHHDALVSAWQKVLLNQFHDVIPGSSINLVYRDAHKLYAEVRTTVARIMKSCRSHLLQDESENQTSERVIVNTLPWTVKKLLAKREEETNSEQPGLSSKRARIEQADTKPPKMESNYQAVDVVGCGWSKVTPTCPPPVTLRKEQSSYILENQYLQAKIDQYGRVVSLVLVADPSRDVFQRKGNTGIHLGNQLVLYDDVPLYWDAWDTMDYHLQTDFVLNKEGSGVEMKVCEEDPLKVKLQWELKISDKSSLTQEIALSAVNPYLTFHTHVDWHENRKFLKVAFDTVLVTRTASYDTQFGFIERPTHSNTSWESAKFEVCSHKWADLSEHDFGVALLNKGKYGSAAKGGRLTLSLLRSPKAPDPQCDMGRHNFRYALMPHTGSLQTAGVQQRAYEFNVDFNFYFIAKTNLRSESETWVSVVGSGVMVAAVKLAEDRSGAVIVRLYEMHGASSTISLKVQPVPIVKKAHTCSGLEVPEEELPVQIDEDDHHQYVQLHMSPFKIVSVRFVFGKKM